MNVPHRDDAALRSRPDAEDHDLPGPVDDVDSAVDGTDGCRPFVPFLDVPWRLHGVVERAGFPRGANDRPFPLDRVLAHPGAVLPRRPEALPVDHDIGATMSAANVPHANIVVLPGMRHSARD